MKKLLFSTLALAAVVVASPVLANEGNSGFEPFGPNTPALKDSPQKPAPGSEHSVPVNPPAGAQPMNPEVINDPSTATPADGEPHVVFENGKYWGVVKFPGGENRIELKPEYEEVNGQKYPKVGLSEEIIAGLMSGVPGSEEDKKSEENKPADKAVKDAVAAAKKEAAKPAAKDGKKVLPNTSAVK